MRVASGSTEARRLAVSDSRNRCASAIPQGAFTRPPKTECSTMRQAPSSSRKYSTTIVRSSGTMTVAARCSATYRSHALRHAHGPCTVLSLPEGHPRRSARCRVNDHAVVLNGRDAPRGGAQLEHVAYPRLVHELLIQLAKSRAVGKRDSVEAPIGN